MKRLIQTLILAFTLLLLPAAIYAQETASTNDEKTGGTSPAGSGDLLTEQLSLLRQRKTLLQKRLATLATSDIDHALTADWIREIDEKVAELKRNEATVGSPAEPNTITVSNVTVPSFVSSQANPPGRCLEVQPPQVQTKPCFHLSRPQEGTTNEIPELQLVWTENNPRRDDMPPPTANYVIKKFIVEIAIDETRKSDKRFLTPVFVTEGAWDGEDAKEIKVPAEILKSGQKYHWQVLAEYEPQGSTERRLEPATNAIRSFKTEAQTFAGLEGKGFTLQRAVSGDDATEGAEFGFLKTFNKNTVYTADFALIYNGRPKQTQKTSFAFQASVQGSLASDDSESEDSLQFRAGAIIDRNLKRDTLNGLYLSLAAKYEADRKFKVGKLISENMVTPTFPALGIGIPFGRSSDPIQFRWRPFFYFDVGHTFNKGDSEETQDTVLRLTPRVRAMLTLNFLRRILNLNDTFIYADNYFYYTPLEKTKHRHNMFTSGFSLQVTKNFGFGLTYKNGEAAPKFKRVNTFGGVLTIRFGKDE